MNENARELYEDLAGEKLQGFNMRDWCGTACCIGGNAQARMSIQKGIVDFIEDVSEVEIARWLGLDYKVAVRLFYPRGDAEPWVGICDDPYNATQQQAAEALKRACELSAMTPAIQRGGE